MFAFIENLFLKNKAKKLLSYIEKIETALTLFQCIDNKQDKNVKLIHSLSKKEFYADIISRYNVCIQKIEKHNEEIQTLTFAYNTLMQTYPIADILDNIFGRINEDQFPKSKSNSETEPTVFVIQSKSIYINSKINADFIHYILPELLDVAEDRNYIFIFTDVKKITDIEVNSVFNSSLKSIFVLDNIAEFASERGSKTVFGDMDIKSLKEDYAKCELGDGYYYDVEADNLKKMKFIKNNWEDRSYE